MNKPWPVNGLDSDPNEKTSKSGNGKSALFKSKSEYNLYGHPVQKSDLIPFFFTWGKVKKHICKRKQIHTFTDQIIKRIGSVKYPNPIR